MKIHSEFSSIIIKAALEIKQRIGSVPEALDMAFENELKIKADRKKLLRNTLEIIEGKPEKLHRVVIYIYNKNDSYPKNAIIRDEKVYVPEFYPKTITSDPRPEEECLSKKPADLGRIEEWLLGIQALAKSESELASLGFSEDQCEYLTSWKPVRGWVVDIIRVPEIGSDPDYHVYYAYEIEGEFHSAYYTVGYDGFHWALHSPEHIRWFRETLVPGKAITVLVDSYDYDVSKIFGQLEFYKTENEKKIWVAH